MEDRNLLSVAHGSTAGCRREARRHHTPALSRSILPKIVTQDRTLQCYGGTDSRCFSCRKWRNSWWKCRRPFPKTESSSGLWSRIVDAPVPQAVEKLAEVSRVFSQDRIQQRTVEQTTPATSLAEKVVEVPVIQTEEKTRQGVNMFGSTRRQCSRSGEVRNHQADRAETHHPGEDQPSDQAC